MSKVSFKIAGSADVDQRLDNYLFKVLKGVPKSRIYKAIRSGEVRVNGSRARFSHRLKIDDQIRIPPLRLAESESPAVTPQWAREISNLYEDERLLVIDKPSGIPVHGGTGISNK